MPEAISLDPQQARGRQVGAGMKIEEGRREVQPEAVPGPVWPCASQGLATLWGACAPASAGPGMALGESSAGLSPTPGPRLPCTQSRERTTTTSGRPAGSPSFVRFALPAAVDRTERGRADHGRFPQLHHLHSLPWTDPPISATAPARFRFGSKLPTKTDVQGHRPLGGGFTSSDVKSPRKLGASLNSFLSRIARAGSRS
jgi:hypothetical protein